MRGRRVTNAVRRFDSDEGTPLLRSIDIAEVASAIAELVRARRRSEQMEREQLLPSFTPISASTWVSGYASMPVSPYPHFSGPGAPIAHRGAGPDVRSQASGGSGDGSGSGSDHKRRQVVIPAAPSTSAIPARLDEVPSDLAASRQSFRMAMNHPYEFFVDNL